MYNLGSASNCLKIATNLSFFAVIILDPPNHIVFLMVFVEAWFRSALAVCSKFHGRFGAARTKE